MKVLNVLKVLMVLSVLTVLGAVRPAAAAPADSERLGRAKDYIADEHWLRAIAELRVVVKDKKEPARDEAAFWLAHSLYQAGDPAEALTVIDALERDRPRSRWVKPARSLRIEIAHRLQRKDLLWRVAAPVAIPPPPSPGSTKPRANVRAPTRVVTSVGPEIVLWDADLRIQALSSLMSSDAPRVVPILRDIALKAEDDAEARRAIYVLAQSNRTDARSTIVEIARTGDEPRQVTAVKVLAYQGWPESEKVLLDVYGASTPHVKRQVIRAFGSVKARKQLRSLFDSATDLELKYAIINALFEAGASSELERIARQDRDADCRRAAASKVELVKPASK